MNPHYLWARHRDAKAGDEIEISHEKHAFLIKARIAAVDKDSQSFAYKLLPGYPADLTEIEAVSADLEGATVTEEGALKWCVRLGGFVVKSGMPSETLAREGWKRSSAWHVLG